MGLATRIIPTLLFRGDQLVKGERFHSWRSVGHVAQAAKIYGQRGADEIILLDIGATPEGRGPNLEIVEKIARDFFTPLTVGGGVRSVNDVRDLLNAGADKVAICTAAVSSSVVFDAAEKFGSQAIVVAIDERDYEVVTWCGTNPWPVKPEKFAAEVADRGAGEILITAIEREGTMAGYDIELIREVSAAVSIPVIAHGGCKDYNDMACAIDAGASAVAAGALFQFNDATPKEAAKYLHSIGIEVRL